MGAAVRAYASAYAAHSPAAPAPAQAFRLLHALFLAPAAEVRGSVRECLPALPLADGALAGLRDFFADGSTEAFSPAVAEHLSAAPGPAWREKLIAIAAGGSDSDRDFASLFDGPIVQASDWLASVLLTLYFCVETITAESARAVLEAAPPREPIEILYASILVGNRTRLLTTAFPATRDVVFAAHIADLAMRDVSWLDVTDPVPHRRLAVLRLCDWIDGFCAAHERALNVAPLRKAIPLYLASLGEEVVERFALKGCEIDDRLRKEKEVIRQVREARETDSARHDGSHGELAAVLHKEYEGLGSGARRAVLNECAEVVGDIRGLAGGVLVAMVRTQIEEEDPDLLTSLTRIAFDNAIAMGELPSFVPPGQ
jgi:hypothetical protein